MAPTFPAVDNATLKALRKGDAGALEKIHRATYTAVVAEAGRHGGDASMGPPVAELAMLQLWENRANIENAEELEQAIHTAVRGGVTREQRRRAANKEGAAATGAPATVDSAWARISAEISKAPAAPAAHKHVEGKRPVAEKAKADGGRGGMIAVGVLLLVAAAVGGYYVMQSGEHGVAESSYTLPDAKSVSVTPGQRGNLPLAPGDTAIIGSDTKITQGGDYGTKVRAVRVDGSADFRVSNGVRFEVNAKNASIVTAGGSFAVRAYKDDSATIVRVKQGEVKVDQGKNTRTVSAGQSVAIASDGTMSDPSAEAVDQALGWTDGHIAFTNAPLKLVMAEYARWYDLPVTTKDSSLLSRPVTLSVALESKKDAISALEESAHVKFSYDKDSKPVLEDAPAKPAGKASAKPAGKAGKKPAAAKKKGE
jgi:ferric-dicitrate binding protein FerR (iron transport regulator)